MWNHLNSEGKITTKLYIHINIYIHYTYMYIYIYNSNYSEKNSTWSNLSCCYAKLFSNRPKNALDVLTRECQEHWHARVRMTDTRVSGELTRECQGNWHASVRGTDTLVSGELTRGHVSWRSRVLGDMCCACYHFTVPNLSKKSSYSPNLVWIITILKLFLCVCYHLTGLPNGHMFWS